MRRALSSLSVAALLALSAAPALARTVELPPPDSVMHQQSAGDYRITPQDVLDIDVDQVADLSKAFTVDTSGKLLLPLVGEIQASGRTPAQLSDDIAAALKKHYMKNPQVVVSVKESQGQKITVDGAVNAPGAYSLNGPTTLMQAVSLAKGTDPHFANLHKVAIFRTIDGQRRSAIYDLAAIRMGRANDPAVYGSDIVVVDTSGTKDFFQNFQGGFGLLGMLIRPW